MSCIFCRDSVSEEKIEHILPESLGGKDWACLPPGLVCGSCNQYFGSKVESLALGSFPFLPFRLMLGIPTKKGKSAKMKIHLGELKASFLSGLIGIEPDSKDIECAIEKGRITQFRLLAEPTEPIAICRLLLKMAIEIIAIDSKEEALSEKYDAARTFARAPKRNSKWWFLIHTDHKELFNKFKFGVSYSEWIKNIELRVSEIGGAEMFVLKLLDITIMAPLMENIIPHNLDELPEPEYRLFEVKQ